MHPVLFHVAGYPVEVAGTLYLVAAILAGVYALRVCRQNQWDSNLAIPGLLLTVLAAYVGARLYGAIVGTGGLSFFGGLALGSLTMLGYLRWQRLPLAKAMDALVPLAPVVYALFR